jgi:hypothetical protein
LEKGLDKAHITATSPEDQGHVETEILEALPLSHSLEFFLFKERGGRARFASSCPVKKKKEVSTKEGLAYPTQRCVPSIPLFFGLISLAGPYWPYYISHLIS